MTPIVLPDAGRYWRWLGGTKPPVCVLCGQEPAVASYRPLNNGPDSIGWECLKRLHWQAPDDGDEGDEGGDGGSGDREPRSPLPDPPSLEIEANP